MARKFDVGRGLTLYEQHESTRIREGLVHFEPAIEPLRTELETGKFTVLVSSSRENPSHENHSHKHTTHVQSLVHPVVVKQKQRKADQNILQ